MKNNNLYDKITSLIDGNTTQNIDSIKCMCNNITTLNFTRFSVELINLDEIKIILQFTNDRLLFL